jgi:hypothetical protein
MVTLSKCTEKGLYFGAITFAIGTLIGDNIKHRLIGSVSDMTGIIAGNYIVRNSRFCNDWEEKTKLLATVALGFFTSCIFWSTASIMDKSIQLPKKLQSEAGSWVLSYLLPLNLITVSDA